MKQIRQAAAVAAAFVILLAAVFIQSQNRGPQRYEGQFWGCFDTVATVTGYDKSQEDFSGKLQLLHQKLTYYHQLYDIYHTYDGMNNMKTINDAAGIKAVKVDSEVFNLLKLGKEMYERTGGKLQIAYGSVLSLWHEYREKGQKDPEHAEAPPQEELARRASHTDMEDLILDEEASTVFLADPQMSLDVGSIGKGYAVQRLSEYAREIGMEHALISVGGNVCAVGKKADGTPWTVGVENPDPDSGRPYIATVDLEQGSLVTSGDYQRYYEADGVRYCHIIDTDTNMPPEYFSSVTVYAEDSGIADALSTALFNMDYKNGSSLIEGMEKTEAMWVGTDGEIRYSGGFKANEET